MCVTCGTEAPEFARTDQNANTHPSVQIATVEEPGSDLATELWDGCDVALSSRLAYPEVRAALAAAGRNHDLHAGRLATALGAFEDVWSATRPVELTANVERHAGALTSRHGLRGADAVHLASALAIGDTDLVVAVWDRRIHPGVIAKNLAVAPPTIAP